MLRAALPLPGVTTKRVRPPGAHGRTDPGGDDDLGLHCPQTPDGCVVRSLLNSYSVLKKKKKKKKKGKRKKRKSSLTSAPPRSSKTTQHELSENQIPPELHGNKTQQNKTSFTNLLKKRLENKAVFDFSFI